MAETVANIVTKLQLRFPDVPTTDAILYINAVHRTLCTQIPSLIWVTQTIVTSDNTDAYDLNADTIEISRVHYTGGTPSATTTLDPVSRDQLFASTPLWTQTTKSTPNCYFWGDAVGTRVSDLKITIYPKPTGAGSLTVYSSVQQTLQSADSLPEGLATYDNYLEGASYYTAASLRGQKEALEYLPVWNMWTELNKSAWKTFEGQQPVEATFPYKPK